MERKAAGRGRPPGARPRPDCRRVFEAQTAGYLWPAPSRCNVLLSLTSCGFGLAGVFAVMRGDILLGVTALLTCALSINYWRDEGDSLRHKLDSVCAKVSFSIFTVKAIARTHESRVAARIALVGWPCWIGVVGFFMWSSALSKRRDTHGRAWVFPHAMFHVCVSVGQILVVMAGS